MFAYGEVLDPMKMCCGKYFVEKYVEHNEDENIFWQWITELIDVLKKEHQAVQKCHICFEDFNYSDNRKIRGHCHYTSLYLGAAQNNCNLKYWIPDHIRIMFHNLSHCYVRLFLKRLKKCLNKLLLVPLQRAKRITVALMLRSK